MKTLTKYNFLNDRERSHRYSYLTTKMKNPPRKKGDPNNAARERNRVRTLRNAFSQLQQILPSVPPDTKLSKLDILILATAYIRQLSRKLESRDSKWCDDKEGDNGMSFSMMSERGKLQGAMLHPVKKWPMRSMFYSTMIVDEKKKWAEPKIISRCIRRNEDKREQYDSVREASEINRNFSSVSGSDLRLEDILQDILKE